MSLHDYDHCEEAMSYHYHDNQGDSHDDHNGPAIYHHNHDHCASFHHDHDGSSDNDHSASDHDNHFYDCYPVNHDYGTFHDDHIACAASADDYHKYDRPCDNHDNCGFVHDNDLDGDTGHNHEPVTPDHSNRST